MIHTICLYYEYYPSFFISPTEQTHIWGGFGMRYLTIFLSIVSALMASGAAAQAPMFEDPIPYEVGSGPGEIFCADFNADGHMDIATHNGNILILLNNGDGTFQPEIEVETDDASFVFFIGEFNGDNFPDIATDINRVGFTGISVLINNGDMTFDNNGEYAVPPVIRVITGGNFNDDIYDDLAISHFHYEKANFSTTIFMNNGDGTFTQENPFITGPVYEAAPGDYDGNGFCDFALAADYLIAVILSNGDGSFSGGSIPMEPGVTKITSGDFDNNGSPDIAFTEWPNQLILMLNNGDGTFPAQLSYTTEEGSDVAAADLDDDNDADVVVGRGESQGVDVYYNDGLGNLRTPVLYPLAGHVSDVYLADFDGDQDNDMAVSCNSLNTVFILMNRTYPYEQGDANRDDTINIGDAIFLIAYIFNGGPAPIPVAAGDANGDGSTDVGDAVYLIAHVFGD
jgi:hypothetical protein